MQCTLQDNIIPQSTQDALQFFLTTFAIPTYLTREYCYERIKPDSVMFNAFFFPPPYFTSRSGGKGA